MVLPGAAPYIVTGVRLAATYGLLTATVAEIVGGAPGLGQQIVLAEGGSQYGNMYALVVMTGVIGVAVNTLLQIMESRVLHWHVSQRSGKGG